MSNLTSYLGEGEMITNPPAVAGRPGLSRPMRLIWLGAPYVFSQAHEGTEHVTTYRHQTFDKYAQGVMRKLGVPVVDAGTITQSQWESAYDGLHYLLGSSDNWNGLTSAMVFQAVMNVIFPACGS